MTARPAGAFIACSLAAMLGASRIHGQDTAPKASPPWAGSAAAFWYLLPDDENFVLPIVTARRDRLHLEARYNYEDRDTGSLFGGWAFAAGTKVEFEATPMLGAVVGRTDGIAPGCTFTLAWKKLAFFSENEYVFDLSDRTENFFYNWSELTYDPVEWLSAGMVTQRTRVYQTDRDLQRGLLVRFARGPASVAGYWFNPGSADDFGILSLEVEF